MQDCLDLLMRNKSEFKERINLWMRQLISSITSVQESAVTQLPSQLYCTPVPPSSAVVPPLPFGPKEQAYFHADGELETATAEELSTEDDSMGSGELFYCVPGVELTEAYQSARHAKLPLRNHSGDEVDPVQWEREYAESSTGLWSNPLKKFASAVCPAYRRTTLCDDSSGQSVEGIQTKIPVGEWSGKHCLDARELVIGCAIHVCGTSCFKYSSYGASHICRHNFYNVVTLVDHADKEFRRRSRGKALRGCASIFRDTRFGMAGRVSTIQ
jgi:hypothetical protein